jgi:general stress protein 26
MMTIKNPTTELDSRFSSPDAAPLPWTTGQDALEQAEVFWLTTVRPDGRPHVTPLISVWLDGALHFCTGPEEQKAKNLVANTHCAVTTGCNSLSEGLDLVIEGEAVQVRDEDLLQRLADRYERKYEGWHFAVRDGAFHGDGGRALVFAIAPSKAFGFGKGEPYSQTRWRF